MKKIRSIAPNGDNCITTIAPEMFNPDSFGRFSLAERGFILETEEDVFRYVIEHNLIGHTSIEIFEG